jgi:hypothetical protein
MIIKMGEVIRLPISEYMEWCDLIKRDNPIDLPYCYGYPDECSDCEVKQYLDRMSCD